MTALGRPARRSRKCGINGVALSVDDRFGLTAVLGASVFFVNYPLFDCLYCQRCQPLAFWCDLRNKSGDGTR